MRNVPILLTLHKGARVFTHQWTRVPACLNRLFSVNCTARSVSRSAHSRRHSSSTASHSCRASASGTLSAQPSRLPPSATSFANTLTPSTPRQHSSAMTADSVADVVAPAGGTAAMDAPLATQTTTSSPVATTCAETANTPASLGNGLATDPHLGPPYDQTISSDFLGPGPLPAGRRIYLVVLNYCLPAGLLHVWPKASFRICADGGCNRLHDELLSLAPPLSPRTAATTITTTVATTEGEEGEGTAEDTAARVGSANGTHAAKLDGSWGTCSHAAAASPAQHCHQQLSCAGVEAAEAAGGGSSSNSGESGGRGHPLPSPDMAALSLRLAHLPDMVLGDLDSLRPDVRQFYLGHGVPFLDLSYDQDTNDLTKAIFLIKERFIDTDPLPHPERHQILVLGALGGRLDHTLANLNVLHMFPDLNIALWGDGNLVRLVRPGTALIKPDERFEGPTCGLIPIAGPVTGTSTGLRWNLADTAMRVGGLVSSSNLLTGCPVEVRCDGPVLWSTEMRDEPRPDPAELWTRTAAAAGERRTGQERAGEAAAQEAAARG